MSEYEPIRLTEVEIIVRVQSTKIPYQEIGKRICWVDFALEYLPKEVLLGCLEKDLNEALTDLKLETAKLIAEKVGK